VGHATEYDRAIGFEANYAGTSFATPDGLGTLRYGSELMHVTGDRTAEFGLATVAWDHEGVAAGTWDIVRDGVLTGYQLDRWGAARLGEARSNGCAYADDSGHVQIQRMPNVSLQPAAHGPGLDALVGGVTDGLLVVGDKSWSIDMNRRNFQFTAQRFYRIRNGSVTGQVKDIAYQSDTLEFWNKLVALGGEGTYELGGAFNCGKGQPGQVAAVSHGCPAAVFEGVNVLATGNAGGAA
jgi:TldD protein